ncbi:unnamed protein product [Meloidogyne enterolobii]|uniref:Uncharacterized protein n=1 Tax=Meloidogyne enterolobii TaxID=390850 RepID=A0ACB1ACG7_MELEN
MYRCIHLKFLNIIFLKIKLLILILSLKMLLISEIEATFISKTRTKRSPDSESIQRWKLAFSGDISTPFASSTKFPSILTCNWALHELCLKHVSCRELWVLFRRNCVVDAQNNCRMSNKNDCWQSYEGISWTGLGACTCPGNNSDCHWIRLQTTYNKCICKQKILKLISDFS